MHLPQIARAALLALLPISAAAAPLVVAVDASRVAEAERGFAVTARGASGRVVASVVRPSRAVQLDLEPGAYQIALAEPGYWAEAREVYVPAAGASVRLAVYAEGVVTGRVTVARPHGEFRGRLNLRFQSADSPAGGPRGETDCTIVRGSFSCRVPVARLDLALKAEGCITRYRWGVDTAAGGADVGEVDLVPGALLTGYVAARSGVTVEKAIVRATPRRAAPAAGDVREERSALTSISVPVNVRGFFHFDGIAPGEYMLEASAGAFRSARQSVRVIEAAEAELRKPLVLEEPHDVEVAVRPTRDPYNRRWVVKLERRGEVDMLVETERHETMPEDGRATLRSIPAGEYTLVLRSQGGETWAQRAVAVPEVSLVEITLPKTFLRGIVTLGGQPLQADLEFRQRGGAAVAARSAGSGRFAFFFPEEDVEWIDSVRIRSDAPRVDRTLNRVRIVRDEGKATLAIALPATYLAGVVVDQQGRPVSRGLVRVESPREATMQEVPTRDDGSFEIHALAPGRLRVRAYGVRASSGAVDVEVAEHGPTDAVRLVVQPALRLTGRVLSNAGPLPGAIVYAFPRPGGAVVSPIHTTGADGRYEINLPAGTTEVDVFVTAPSFATQFFRRPLAGSTEMDVLLSQTSGALLVDTGEARRPLLRHRGAEVGLNLFSYHGATRSASRLRIPNLEPGAYAICSDAATCVTATVVPHAEVAARIPESP